MTVFDFTQMRYRLFTRDRLASVVLVSYSKSSRISETLTCMMQTLAQETMNDFGYFLFPVIS